MHSTPESVADSDAKPKPDSGANSHFNPKPDSDAQLHRLTKPAPRSYTLPFPYSRRSPTAAEPP
jgi:hypothetical protein